MADCLIKKISKKSLRIRKKASSDEDESEEDDRVSSKIEDLKIIQKTREKPRGVDIVGLTVGASAPRPEENSTNDTFKIKRGGMVNMKNVIVTQVDDAYDVGIGTQFSAETNKRDEDEEMMKYIDEQMSKKKDVIGEVGEEQKAYYTPEEAALQAVPEHLRASSGQRSEEMLSNQMLSGIPEVDLGIESKIRNIEATEDAKMKLIWSQKNKKEAPSQFVPTNITVNFAQPTKINTDEADTRRNDGRGAKRPADEDSSSRPSGKSATDRATDDFLYEKFKKQFRRY